MKLIEPTLPELDLAEWRRRPFLSRIRPFAVNWAENGGGSPLVVYLFYIVKIGLYALGAIAVTSTTPGLGSIGNFGSWWSEPIVFQKLVIWTLLWEVVGLGGASGPLMYRFKPPIGASLYWLRPGTIRLPPWPDKIPFTRGNSRSLVDVVLYAGVLASALWLLFSPGVGGAGLLDHARLIPLAVVLPLLGLRDKTIFLAARSENYWVYLLLFFFPVGEMLIGAKLVMVVLWVAVAVSKINHHFSYVVPTMVSNSPLQRSKWFKRKLYRDFPDDLRPSTLAAVLAYSGVFFESVPPLLLLFSRGGTLTTVLLVVMVLWHLHILSTIPMAVPLEWNLFFIFGTLFLFGAHAGVGFSSLDSPLLVVGLIVFAAIPVLGNIRPDLVNFLWGMRYYAGNWAMSLWCYRKGAEAKIDENIVKSAPGLKTQLSTLYPDDVVEWFLFSGPAFLAMHLPGQAMCGLLPRALDDVENYDVRAGEFEAGHLIGWNFGDGHLYDEQLLEAVQERCQFAEGELRIVIVESQPIHRLRQHYRIVDAATGQVEEGYLSVRDLITCQPWLDEDSATLPGIPGSYPGEDHRTPIPAAVAS